MSPRDFLRWQSAAVTTGVYKIGYGPIRHQWDDLILWRTLIQLRTDIPIPTIAETHQPSSLPSAPDIIGQLDLWK